MAPDYGWDVILKSEGVAWNTLRQNVQNYIKSINFSYKTKLKEIGADYINAKARISKDHKVTFELEGEQHTINAKNIVIAVGGKPRYLPNKAGSTFKYEEE